MPLTNAIDGNPSGQIFTMTNVEIIHQEALKALESGNLNEKQKQFVESIRGFDKKQLKKLNGAQFKWLKDIAKLNTRPITPGLGAAPTPEEEPAD